MLHENTSFKGHAFAHLSSQYLGQGSSGTALTAALLTAASEIHIKDGQEFFRARYKPNVWTLLFTEFSPETGRVRKYPDGSFAAFV